MRRSGIASVLAVDDELGGPLGLATESETVTGGAGSGWYGGSPMIAITAIPIITPTEVAATPAATSRNMTIYRLADGHIPRLCDDGGTCSSLWHREGQGWHKRLLAARATMHGLASIHHNQPYGFHSAGTPSEIPSERLGGRDRKWVAVVHETAAPSHVALMPRLGIEPLACEGRVVVAATAK